MPVSSAHRVLLAASLLLTVSCQRVTCSLQPMPPYVATVAVEPDSGQPAPPARLADLSLPISGAAPAHRLPRPARRMAATIGRHRVQRPSRLASARALPAVPARWQPHYAGTQPKGTWLWILTLTGLVAVLLGIILGIKLLWIAGLVLLSPLVALILFCLFLGLY